MLGELPSSEVNASFDIPDQASHLVISHPEPEPPPPLGFHTGTIKGVESVIPVTSEVKKVAPPYKVIFQRGPLFNQETPQAPQNK